MLQSLIYSISVTLPILAMMLLGYALRRGRLVDEAFVNQGSAMVFFAALPSLLFSKVANTDWQSFAGAETIAAGIAATLIVIFLSWFLARWIAPDAEQKGVFVQGAFRSNMGIIGLALVLEVYGDQAGTISVIYLAILTILYNVMAVLVLAGATGQRVSIWAVFKMILKNPLIIALILGLVVAILTIQLPRALNRTLELLAAIALPVALICIGAKLEFQRLKWPKQKVVLATIIKLILAPAIGVFLGLLLNVSHQHLGVLYLMGAAPSAAASFVMARQMQGDEELAADIVAVTNVYSIFSTAIGLTLFIELGWLG